MTTERPKESWQEWSSDTTARNGRERGLGAYESYLGFQKEELEGKRVVRDRHW